jgi:hypothetical protein
VIDDHLSPNINCPKHSPQWSTIEEKISAKREEQRVKLLRYQQFSPAKHLQPAKNLRWLTSKYSFD